MSEIVVKPVIVSSKPCMMKGAASRNEDSGASQSVSTLPSVSANGNFVSPVQTTLITKAEKEKFNTVCQMVDKNNLSKVNELLSTGKLLDKKYSNDDSSVLDNLYKMATTKRASGLDAKVVLNETINTIHNPFLITQKFGDIPKEYRKEILNHENQTLKLSGKNKKDSVKAKDIDIKESACCVAASIEFNMAHRMPAEFARMVEGLSSEKYSVEKVIDTKTIALNYVDSMTLLSNFKTEPAYEQGIDKVRVKLEPDKNAIIRARIQTTHKDPGERSVVDVLMQSMLMNVGSAKTYDSLLDNREGYFDKGLANVEKTFTECLVTGKNNILVNYQIIDDDLTLKGYECPLEEMKKHLTDSLKEGSNVIIGYTDLQDDGKINPDGHEITIIGIEKDKAGKEYFVCKDTDSSNRDSQEAIRQIQHPVRYEVSELLPRIHHAGISYDVLRKNNVEFERV